MFFARLDGMDEETIKQPLDTKELGIGKMVLLKRMKVMKLHRFGLIIGGLIGGFKV